MSVTQFLIYFFEFIAALSAISLVFVRNVFYGALFLIVCLLAIAALYILAFAEFVAVTQILVYAGGILVVIIFGIMVTTKTGNKPLRVTHSNVFAGMVVTIALLGLLIFLIEQQTFPASTQELTNPKFTALQSIGIGLMSDFVLPFEIAGVLLLISLIGAAVIASNTKSNKVS